MRVLIIEDFKAIALMHGGDVFVRSDHGMNTFGIHLPVCPRQMIVPTLRVGMQPGTLRVPFQAERGASVEAFPRRAWERSVVNCCLKRNSPFMNPLFFPSQNPLIFAAPNSTCQARRF